MSENKQKWIGGLLGIHAQTALHPGSGTSLGVVDLPVQRERHTQWPTIAGSALKGVLRDAGREIAAGARHDGNRKKANEEDDELTTLFGHGNVDESNGHAGALGFTDARLLAFPVRSLKGVFAWVSCHAALDRLKRDAELAGIKTEWHPPAAKSEEAVLPDGCLCVVDNHLVFEEYDFKKADGNASEIANWIADHVLPKNEAFAHTRERFKKQFVVLSDDDFTHFARHATEVTARIALDYERKTVKTGALFYQEFVPAETLFYSLVLAKGSRKSNSQVKDIWGTFEKHCPPILQIGGDETTGKGLCALRLNDGKDGA